MAAAKLPVGVHVIYAGKWRRYRGLSWWQQLSDVSTLLLNLRDTIYLGLGSLQSLWLMLRWRPDVVFTKGGFVCVPVGLAARLLGVPIVMHDSDAHPGLANRILARWATSIATGSPLKYYAYPKSRSRYVGVPVSRDFHYYSDEDRLAAKRQLELPDTTRPLLVATGGGLGARRVNDAILAIAERLVGQLGISILHITGQDDFERCRQQAHHSAHYQLRPFVAEGMAEVLGAADIVVTRAGATTMLELAALGSTVIIIPHPYLSGGHQLKNATVYQEADAALVIQEAELQVDPERLFQAVSGLIGSADSRRSLAEHLAAMAKPEAARDVAAMVMEAGRQ